MKFLYPVFLPFLAFLFITFPGGLSAQGEWAIHRDKPFYVTGEVIWFTLFPPAGADREGHLLQMAVYDPQGNSIDEFHLTVSEGLAKGYYKIPYQWQEGRYRFFTYCRSSEEALPPMTVPVYNDLDPLNVSAEQLREPPALSTTPFSEEPLEVEITVDRPGNKTGGEVDARITVRNGSGVPVPARLSIAVTDDRLTTGTVKSETLTRFNEERCGTTDSMMVFAGHVYDADGSPIRTGSLAAYVDALDTILYTKSNTKGAFELRLTRFSGTTRIQFTDYFNPEVRVERRKTTDQGPAPALPYTEAVLDYIKWSRQRKKIYQLFGTLETVLTYPEDNGGKGGWHPDRQIVIDHYEPFETLVSLFREVATTLKFRGKPGAYRAEMSNPDIRQFYRLDPLFFIDGYFTKDANYVTQLDITEVKTIDLFFDAQHLEQQFGRLGLGGVAVITTKSGNSVPPPEIAPNIFTFSGVQPPAEFSASPSEEKDAAPDFRPLIFWEGQKTTTAQGEAHLTFHHSDDRSTFRIQVVAQSRDGNIGTGSAVYTVKQ